jgi:GlpG protein
MRHLASLPDAGQAENFGDYLTALGIPNSRDESGGKWAIWVEREEQLDQARRELEEFQREPGAEKYRKAGEDARAFESAQEQLSRRLARNFINVRLQHAQEDAVQQGYPATLILIAICVVVGMISRLGDDIPRLDGFFFLPPSYFMNHGGWMSIKLIPYFGFKIWAHDFWRDTALIRQGQVWRLITPIFIHFGVTHLLFNMWWLWDLGRMIERRKGTVFFVILVVVSGLISNLGQFMWAGPLFGGMSGVVYALFGYAWMKGKFQPAERIGVTPQTVMIMLVWLVVCMTGLLGPYLSVANADHLVGMVTGMIFGIVPWVWFRVRKEIRMRPFRAGS